MDNRWTCISWKRRYKHEKGMQQRSNFRCHSVIVEIDPELHVFFSTQLMVPLKTQEDLDQAVTTLGGSPGVNGLLRILLKTPKNNPVSAEDGKLIHRVTHSSLHFETRCII